MATIKSYTDIFQSKKLAEILPIESADMYYDRGGLPSFIDKYVTHESIKNDKYQHLIPCWSLAALMKILHRNEDIVSLSYGGYKDGEYILNWCLDYEFEDGDYTKTFSDNPVDACVAMIGKLNESNLL